MKKIKRILTIFTLALFVVFFTSGKKVDIKAEEIKDERQLKAVWMSTFIGEAPYTSESQFKSYMNGALDMFEYYGINAVIFHVRTHNNAFYNSKLNPLASWWSSVNFEEFDPLGWLIEESHKRGIEFHAWMNPYRVDTNYQTGEVPLSNPQNNPDNLIVSTTTILNPALEEVREHVFDTIIEFAELYPTVDAIHFDDYFYVNTNKEPTAASDRRQQVDLLIEGIYDVLSLFNEENNTAIQFGISPTGIYRNGNGIVTYDEAGKPITTGSDTRGFEHYGEYLYADTLKWAINGWIDYLMPQTYWARNHNVASYTKLIDWWDKVFKNLDVNLYSGIGVYMANESGTYNWANNMQEMDGQLSLLDTKENVSGYSIYSYKHLLSGYNNTNNNAGKQIRNAYLDEARRSIKVVPEIKSMTPKITEAIKNISYENSTLSWDSVEGGKFYYIYKSADVVTYSTDEIVGVIGHKNGKMTYDVSSFGGGNFSVRAISRTNHFSPIEPITTEDHVTIDLFYGYDDLKTKQTILKGNLARKPYDPIRSGYKFLGWYLNDSLFDFNSPVNENITLMAKWEQLEVYNIEYNLNGGTLKTLGYNNRDEMITDFLTDFYNFLNLDIDLNTFMHGDGNVSGYDGLYNNEEYYKYLYMANNKEIDATTGMFINQPEFNKWTVLLDLMEEYTSTGNTNQTGEFWGMPLVVGINRIKPFIRQINLWSYSSAEKNETIMEILNRIPSELVKVNVVNSFTIETPNIILPVAEKEGHNFLGWYLNENFTGDVIENIPQGTNNNISLYAKFSINQTDKVTITFYLNYANIYLPLQEINKGDKVKEPTSPVRSGYNFMGWYLGDVLFDFNQNIEDSIVLVAAWDLTEDIETVKVSFDLDYDDKYLDDVIIEKGTIVEEPITPSRENYKFLGWYFGDELYNFNVVVNENICLKAKWEALKVYDEVVLYFDLGYDGLYLPSVTIEKGTSFYEPYEPVREGYEFVGWTLEDILFDFSQPINTNLTFTAFWKSDGIIKEHIITFSLGYDDLILDIKTVLSGSKLTSVIKPTREGYVFAGWYYGLIRFDFTKEIYEDYLLVARWNEEINVSEKVVTLDGASIRTTVESGVQRLRFYGKIDSSLVGSEFGFYAVYGKTTAHDLMEKIRENDGQTMYINGRDVKRQAVNKADYNNEFSVVLTGIPKIGYADLLSVVAYAVDKEGNLYLAENVVSRSVLEVAVKMEEANEVTNETQDIIAYAKANMLKLDYDVYGNLEISSSLYEVNHRHIKEVFFKDWNTLFNTSFVDPSANEFFSSAKKGSNNPDRNNTNISNTNIYKFFNNEIYKDKWGWFLDYFKEVDYTIHATGQIEAIKGNGTYTNPNLSSNRNRLYNATHLTHSIYNFFYETNENGGYPAINFYNEGNLNDGLNKYDRYLKVKDFNDKIYIDISSHQVFRMGESIILPEIKETPTSGTTYVYFDGNKYYAPNSYYNVNGKTTFEIREVVVSVYEIKFYDNDVELIELRDYYLIDEGKELPVISKEGYDFMGWYSDASFTGTPITKINKGNSLDKTFYAKWEKTDAKINIVYDFGEYGYHSTTKLELFAEFRKDYKEFYNLDYPIGNTIYDFYKNSKLTLPNKIEEIFLDSQMGEKWDWLENYILIKAQENNYIHLADLQNYNEDVWRLNIQSFFIDGLYVNSESSFVSLDFSSLELAYSFWKYTKYNMYEASYNKTDRLVSSDAVKSWNDEYEFAYWVNEQGKIVNDLSILNNETYYLKAVWKKK